MSLPSEDVLECLSAQFDGESSPPNSAIPADASAPAVPPKKSRELARLCGEWHEIGEHLRSLPVGRSDVVSAAMQTIRRGNHTNRQGVTVATSPTEHVAPQRRQATVAAAVSITVLLVMAMTVSSFHSEDPTSSKAFVTQWPAAWDGLKETSQGDWQVVVVSVPAERHQVVQDRLRKSASAQGLAVETVPSASASNADDSPRVVLSGGDTAEQLLDALDTEVRDLTLGLVVDSTTEFDRERLLNKFRESMESPTAAERYFGEMLVVHADGDSIATETTVIVESRAMAVDVDQRENGSLAAVEASGHGEHKREERPPRGPVLVVLIKQKAETPPEHQGMLWKRQMGSPSCASKKGVEIYGRATT